MSEHWSLRIFTAVVFIVGLPDAASRRDAIRRSPRSIAATRRAWIDRTGDLPEKRWGAETTPLEIGDTLYLCLATNILIALDGTPNKWTTASGDEELGLVYLPMGNAAADYWSDLRSPGPRVAVDGGGW